MTRSSDFSKGAEQGRAVPLVLLAGPTASGKTSLSVELCRRLAGWFPAEIINADSMQVYRRMDVGTAKPTLEQRRIVRHHLIDVADPDEPFDAARYLCLAGPVIEEMKARGRLPLVVGGAGLYMRALTRGLCPGPSSNPEVKRRLIAEEESEGLVRLYGDLLQIDPESAARIHPNDRQRIFRALEVFYIGGVPLSALQKGHGFRQQLFPALKVFVSREREALFERINRRVDCMIEEGFKEEVEGLLAMGYAADLKSMQSIGYRQMAAHIKGAISIHEAVSQIKRETRHYAKRQITWFRGDHEFQSFDAGDIEGIYYHIRQRIEEFGNSGTGH